MLATVCGIVGCASADIAPRPPKHPEEIVVPPVEDGKFSNPPKYPDGTLNQNDPGRQPNTTNPMGGPGGPPGAGGMNGMGGMGGMGGMNGMNGMNGSGMRSR
jgi:hypothetical protein